MSAADIAELFGYLISAWALGFSGGYVLTKFKDAANDATRTG